MKAKKLLILATVATCIGGGSYAYDKSKNATVAHAENTTAQTASSTYTSAMPQITDAIDETILKQELEAIIKDNSNLDVAVAITDLNSGKTYDYGESGNFTAASVTKLITATYFLSQVENGSFSLNTTVGQETASEQLKKMIVNSDNTAWQNFYTLLGKSNQQTYADNIGINDYNVAANTISAPAMAEFLSRLYKQDLLNEDDTNLLLSLMNKANQTEYLYDTLAASGTVYHKVGWLADRLHDVAIVTHGGKAYAIVVFSKSNGDTYPFEQGQLMLQQIAAVSTKTFL